MLLAAVAVTNVARGFVNTQQSHMGHASITPDTLFYRSQASQGKGAARAVYIAPLQALATERLQDWNAKFGTRLGLNVVELTGEPTTDHKLLEKVWLERPPRSHCCRQSAG